MTTQSLKEAFDLMWGGFSGPAMLVGKDGGLLAVNAAGAVRGFAPGAMVGNLAANGPQAAAWFRLPLNDPDACFIHFLLEFPPADATDAEGAADPSLAFRRALAHTLQFEGGYVNDPADPGGETFRGISRCNWAKWEGWPLIDRAKAAGLVKRAEIDRHFKDHADMERLVADFYRQNFWRPFESLALPDRIMAKMFDTAINTGIKAPITFLQKIINQAGGRQIAADGCLGPATRAAAAGAFASPAAEEACLDQLCLKQADYYRGIAERRPASAKFLKGWLRRAAWKPPR